MKKVMFLLLAICLIALVIFAYKNGKVEIDYEEYSQFKENIATDYNEVIDGIYSQSNLVSVDLTTKITDKLKEMNLSGGLSKESLDSIGEGYVPQFILDGKYKEWYTLSTSDGVYYIICQDDEIRVQKDNGN